MEPEKGQLEKETHLQTTILGGSMLVFRGVVLPKTGAKKSLETHMASWKISNAQEEIHLQKVHFPPRQCQLARVKIKSRGDWVTFAPKMSLPGCAMIFP